MIIPQSNSIRFKKVDSNPPNFDNTLLADEKFFNDRIETYCQRWKTTDTVTVQLKCTSATLPTVVATKADNSTVNITPTGSTYVSRYDTTGDGSYDTWHFAFDVDMSLFTTETSIYVTQGAATPYKSEPFKGDSDLTTEIANNQTLVIDYFNIDNAFSIDFSSGAGSITYRLYIPISKTKDYSFGGEVSTYDNQDEITKTRETAQRLFGFVAESIPRYLAETLRLASSMDNFVVNGVSYTRSELPEDPEPIEDSNLVNFKMALIDKEYLGTNSHDVGFDCDTTDEGMAVLTQENASGSVTFSVTAGYLVHTLSAYYVSGTPIIKLGLSVGADELVYPFTLSSGKSTVNIHGMISRDTTTNIYATVTGGVVNLDLQTIKNIQ